MEIVGGANPIYGRPYPVRDSHTISIFYEVDDSVLHLETDANGVVL